jgi:hypothetical protein
MDSQSLHTWLFLRNVEGSKASSSLDAGKVSAPSIVTNFVNTLWNRLRHLGCFFGNFPVCLIRGFEEILEEMLV